MAAAFPPDRSFASSAPPITPSSDPPWRGRPYDASFMAQALALAEHARGRTSPNPLVGAVIVDESGSEPVVLATGYHARAGTDHAEVAALRRLVGRAPGKTIYVTLEPCNHVGRTGKCSEAILAAGLRRVVIGLRDPNLRVAGGGIDRLRAAGVEVAVGLLESACRYQNRGYLRWLGSGRPQLLLKAAISLDGRLAPRPRQGGPQSDRPAPIWLTGSAARHHAHQLRDHSDAILVGAGTVASDDPELTVRLPSYGSREPRRDDRQPLRVVLDGALQTSPLAKVCTAGTLIVTSLSALDDRPATALALRERGVELVGLPGDPSRLPHGLGLESVLALLGQRGLHYVLCEGGASLHGQLLSAGLYDEAALFVAPILLGDSGVPLARDLVVPGVAVAPWLDRLRVESLGPDTLIHGLLHRTGFVAGGSSVATDFSPSGI